MGLFNGIDQDEPVSRGGLLKRLRAAKPSFVEPTQAAEPRFKSARQAHNPQVSFLGRSLSGGDIEDVDSTTVPHVENIAVAHAGINEAATGSAPRDLIGVVDDEGPMAIVLDASYVAGEAALRELDAAIASQRHQVRASPEVIEAESIARAAIAQASIQEPPKAVASVAPVHTSMVEDELPFDNEEDRSFAAKADAFVSEAGRPALVSAEALPEFKRILTTASDDAALRISATARTEFVAVELQPGIAIVVATPRFCERAQFATFIKDLSNNDVFVKEEMVATEAVIAEVYALKAIRATKGVRESSRAIGNFRDIVEAAQSYGASDIHFEPREFNSEVEIRFRVNGDLYTYRNMPKSIVRRALFAAYQDLVQRNTNSGNSFQPTAPQSAMIPLVVKTDTVNLRWQSSPLVGGYDVSLRLLDGNFKNYQVLLPEQMGLEASQLELISTLNYVSGGVTALTGETGSGKTTTLRALSYTLPDRDRKKQFAVNEPSEYPMPWLSDYSIIRRPDETDGPRANQNNAAFAGEKLERRLGKSVFRGFQM